ncbi:hypothetical protein SteCoe_4104 [Stentor coeruleus]|uniref:Uncharacterized protein n=1 Tax=Stentor coeruleus TaxID=5963 RepID=A0A1R2CVL6_9CILI|nr:hypothetical protein SteCoe_4104 [Stentor coeruleus]
MNLINLAKIFLVKHKYCSKFSLSIGLQISLETAEILMNELALDTEIFPTYTRFIENRIEIIKGLRPDKGFIYSLNYLNHNENIYEIESELRCEFFTNGQIKYFPSRVGCFLQDKRRNHLTQSPKDSSPEITKKYMTRKASGKKPDRQEKREGSLEKILKENTYTIEEGDEKMSRLQKYLKRKAPDTSILEKKPKKTKENFQPKLTSFYSNR